MSSASATEIYDEYYFRHGCGTVPYERSVGWSHFFGGLADRIVREINPRTVLDAGCAMGFLVESLRDRGVEAFGVDISDYAISQVRDDVRHYCWKGSILEAFPQRYDLIVCIEVLEHLPRKQSEDAIINLCQFSDDVLFSSSPLDYKEVTHFNVQPPEYWAEQFAHQGLLRDVDFDASFITAWAARFRRRHEPLPRIIRDYERRFWLLSKENHDLRTLSFELRDKLAAAEQHTVEANRQMEAQARQIEEQANLLRRNPLWRAAYLVRRLLDRTKASSQS